MERGTLKITRIDYWSVVALETHPALPAQEHDEETTQYRQFRSVVAAQNYADDLGLEWINDTAV